MELKLNPEQRKRVIINAGLAILKEDGLGAVNFAAVSEKAAVKTSVSTVKYHFMKRDDLWQAIIEADDTGKARKDADAMGFV